MGGVVGTPDSVIWDGPLNYSSTSINPVLTSTVAIIVGTIATPAFAVDVDGQATFGGSILDSCVVNVTSGGTLGVSADKTLLASTETGAGGVAAVAAVTTNSTNSTVQVINPVAFTLGPDDADTNTTFGTSYVLSGATTATENDGTTVTTLGTGVTNMSLDSSATKSSGSFAAGTYSLITTIRCVTP